MTTDKLQKAICDIIIKYPPGKVIWHKANAMRGIVQGYEMDIQGSARVIIDYGNNVASVDFPVTLSDTKLIADNEGEEWKETI